MAANQIRTPRLLLKRLLSNKEGTLDLEYYHRVWSNDQATQWSLHQTSQTKQDSQAWMVGVIPWQAVPGSDQRICFAVLRPVLGNTAQKEADDGASGVAEPRDSRSFDKVPDDDQRGWEVAGILTLLPSKSSPHAEIHSESTAALSKVAVELAYLFVPTAWGFGYATESLEALLGWYLDDVRHAEQATEVDIGANVHPDNKGSIRVLDKLGFGKADELIARI